MSKKSRKNKEVQHCRNMNLDTPYGFQNINPLTYLLVANIIGNYIARNMPINIADSIGNWLQLIATSMNTYSAQQIYFESGPGMFYDPTNKNISNPACKTNEPNNYGRPQ